MFNSHKQHASWNPSGVGQQQQQNNQSNQWQTLDASNSTERTTSSSSSRPAASLSGSKQDNFAFLPRTQTSLQQQQQVRGAVAVAAPRGSQASFTTNSTSDCEDSESLRRLHMSAAGGGKNHLHLAHQLVGSGSLSSSGNGAAGNGDARKQSCCGLARPRCCRAKPGTMLDKLALLVWRLSCVASFLLVLNALVYFWPVDSRYELAPKVAPLKPRPKFAGPLAINDKLDELAEKLYEDQFHAPESMAWTANKRAFFTGVEGGFILLVEPYAERWTIAARLNARLSVEDKSRAAKFATATEAAAAAAEAQAPAGGYNATAGKQLVDLFVPFCTRDIELYGARAEFEPSLVRLSRCSRPLGIRLAPSETHLYVMDPLSGLYRIDLVPNLLEKAASQTRPLAQMNHVSKLLDFTLASSETTGAQDDKQPSASSDASASAVKLQDDDEKAAAAAAAGDSNSKGKGASGASDGSVDQDVVMIKGRPQRQEQLYFGDDIAVEWAAPGTQGGSDLIYITDCSRRWSLRYLFWLMLENDDSGRVMRFDVASSRLSQLEAVLPVRSHARPGDPLVMDERGLSFPNGIELTANKSALLISDLNNRRILMHHLRGPLAGTTNLLMWTPGYSDNVRRGLDQPDGTPTYWFACGCAVSDAKYELAELVNDAPFLRRLLLRWLHVLGTGTQILGRWLDSTRLKDAGLMLDAAWLKVDPYCTHGLVAQFNEQGQILRSLHGPHFGSSFKLLSEAHQVPLLNFDDDDDDGDGANNSTTTTTANNAARSLLYLGSVYYSYLGRLELAPHQDQLVKVGQNFSEL